MSVLQNMIQPKKKENIEDVEYSDIMGTSYVNYAMSVITSRAVPDVRDGLKPVQRRILYDMQQLNTTSDKPHRKSARIVGDTMGKFHAHGDSAIYEAMVVMSQDWKKGKTLVDGHGNFGSIEGDGAAAQRYTEARLEKFSEDVFLEDLKYGTVNMVSNYDETEKEPEVLPCKVPNLLINGSEGIAVGMTTAIPTHNLSEVIDTAIAYLRGTKKIETLMKTLPGPDFPTGGIISNQHELESIYKTGNGRVRIRGKVVFEEGKNGEKDKLVVTQIPYTMIGQGINKFLQDTAKLVEDKLILDITDIINQSSGSDIRIVLELKKSADVDRIKNILYKKTKLEDTLGVNMLTIHDGKPKVMNLIDILDAFSEFQNQIYTRKFNKLLDQANKKKEIDEGLIQAIDLIDVIIAVLRGSKNIKQAKSCLMSGDVVDINFKTKTLEKDASKLNFTEVQADAILSMQLSRLVGLQLDELKKDYDDLIKNIQYYESVLSNSDEMRKEIIKYLQSIKKKYGSDRKTEITDIETPDVGEIEVPEVELIALVDKFNYIHAIEKSSYSRNKQYIDENFKYVIDISSRDKLIIFTDIGKAHMIPMKEIPLKKPRDKGVPIDNLCQFEYSVEHIVGVESLLFKSSEKEFVFVTSSGAIKRTKNSEFFINRKITDSTVLREGENVFKVFTYESGKYIIFETSKGLILKCNQDDIKSKTKYSMGNVGIKLNSGDSLKLVTSDDSKFKDVRKSTFGNAGKVRVKKLM
mgnify:CR=1 FL=1